jgi:hypothetical protein
MFALGCNWQLGASAILHAIPHKTLADKPPVAPGGDDSRDIIAAGDASGMC